MQLIGDRSIVEHTAGPGQKIGVACLYCDYRDSTEQTPVNMTCTRPHLQKNAYRSDANRRSSKAACGLLAPRTIYDHEVIGGE
jgi:hypothetical protein